MLRRLLVTAAILAVIAGLSAWTGGATTAQGPASPAPDATIAPQAEARVEAAADRIAERTATKQRPTDSVAIVGLVALASTTSPKTTRRRPGRHRAAAVQRSHCTPSRAPPALLLQTTTSIEKKGLHHVSTRRTGDAAKACAPGA